MHLTTFEYICEQIDQAAVLGTRQLGDGTKLIGHVPHVAPQAYLHILYPGLNGSDIELLASQIGHPLPTSLQQFLSFANGLDLFSCTLSIHGLRRSFERKGDSARQPFSLVTQNTIERPRKTKPAWLFFVSYCDDGSVAAIDGDTQQIFRCGFPNLRIMAEWKDIDHFLLEEFNRISSMHDSTGRRIL